METGAGKKPSTLVAVETLARVLKIAERFGKVEEQLGPITHAQLKRYFRTVADTLIKFVAPDQKQECMAHLRELLLQVRTDVD